MDRPAVKRPSGAPVERKASWDLVSPGYEGTSTTDQTEDGPADVSCLYSVMSRRTAVEEVDLRDIPAADFRRRRARVLGRGLERGDGKGSTSARGQRGSEDHPRGAQQQTTRAPSFSLDSYPRREQSIQASVSRPLKSSLCERVCRQGGGEIVRRADRRLFGRRPGEIPQTSPHSLKVRPARLPGALTHLLLSERFGLILLDRGVDLYELQSTLRRLSLPPTPRTPTSPSPSRLGQPTYSQVGAGPRRALPAIAFIALGRARWAVGRAAVCSPFDWACRSLTILCAETSVLLAVRRSRRRGVAFRRSRVGLEGGCAGRGNGVDPSDGRRPKVPAGCRSTGELRQVRLSSLLYWTSSLLSHVGTLILSGLLSPIISAGEVGGGGGTPARSLLNRSPLCQASTPPTKQLRRLY